MQLIKFAVKQGQQVGAFSMSVDITDKGCRALLYYNKHDMNMSAAGIHDPRGLTVGRCNEKELGKSRK